MAGGKLLGWLQSNPQIVQGVRGAVNTALEKQGLGQSKDTSADDSAPLELKGKKEDKKQNTMIYVALGAVVLVFLMMKKK